jgi:outer membrane lipoprotein SlyB
MSTKQRRTIITSCVSVLLVFLGCASIQDAVTPCYVAKEAKEYSDVNKPELFFWSLWDAQKVKAKLDFRHEAKQIGYVRMIADDNLEYGFIANAHNINIESAKQLQQSIFSPSGAIGLLIPAASALGIGIMIKRPGDKTPTEVAEIIKNGNNKTVI